MAESLALYLGTESTCSYLPKEQSRNIFPDPNLPMSNGLYSQLIQHGFRRSGEQAYRPHCEQCSACVPVRIKLADFTPNRSQRRCLKRNDDLIAIQRPAEFSAEHYDLYYRYLQSRHLGAGMDETSEEIYTRFLISSWSKTRFIELRTQSDLKLLAVIVTDLVHDGGSAFYTFFDPDESKRSLGTYAILKQIEIIQAQDLPHLYLGYWIAQCQKMSYKTSFSALEGFNGSQWELLIYP